MSVILVSSLVTAIGCATLWRAYRKASREARDTIREVMKVFGIGLTFMLTAYAAVILVWNLFK